MPYSLPVLELIIMDGIQFLDFVNNTITYQIS
jgi:hypothetical protein